MDEPEKTKPRFERNRIIGGLIMIGIMAVIAVTFPIVTDQSFSYIRERIANAKTCSDVFAADQVPFMSGMFIETFDVNHSVIKAIDAKAHELCKPLYDLEKKYGDLSGVDISKMSCDDLGVLVKTMPVKQEVINEYVKCGVK